MSIFIYIFKDSAEHFQTAKTTKYPPKNTAKANPNKESPRHAKKASPDTRVEKVGTEITTKKSRDDIDNITPIEDKKMKRKDRTNCKPLHRSRRPKGCIGKRYGSK